MTFIVDKGCIQQRVLGGNQLVAEDTDRAGTVVEAERLACDEGRVVWRMGCTSPAWGRILGRARLALRMEVAFLVAVRGTEVSWQELLRVVEDELALPSSVPSAENIILNC